MANRSEKMKEAEGKISKELANQASQRPGSPAAEQAKERRTHAEKDLANARNSGVRNSGDRNLGKKGQK